MICKGSPPLLICQSSLRFGLDTKNVGKIRHFCVGDPYGIRTHVTAVKGRCLNRLTKGPDMVAAVRFEPTTCRV